MFDAARRLVPTHARRTISRLFGRQQKLSARRYLPAGTDVEGFFRQAKERAVALVVLRWFSDLPAVMPGEDIDLLVADEDVAAVAELLDPVSGSTPVDLYSAGGLVGTAYKGFPYFPPKLAARTLARRTLRDGVYPQPALDDHFAGLAYHAVYQKGPKAGLASSLQGLEIVARPEHDYFAVLAQLRDELGLAVPLTLEGLDEYLAALDYRPAASVLAALVATNPWVGRRFAG